jgi:hypothetical protein
MEYQCAKIRTAGWMPEGGPRSSPRSGPVNRAVGPRIRQNNAIDRADLRRAKQMFLLKPHLPCLLESTISTRAPSVIESDGSRITASFAVRLEVASTVLP